MRRTFLKERHIQTTDMEGVKRVALKTGKKDTLGRGKELPDSEPRQFQSNKKNPPPKFVTKGKRRNLGGGRGRRGRKGEKKKNTGAMYKRTALRKRVRGGAGVNNEKAKKRKRKGETGGIGLRMER